MLLISYFVNKDDTIFQFASILQIIYNWYKIQLYYLYAPIMQKKQTIRTRSSCITQRGEFEIEMNEIQRVIGRKGAWARMTVIPFPLDCTRNVSV